MSTAYTSVWVARVGDGGVATHLEARTLVGDGCHRRLDCRERQAASQAEDYSNTASFAFFMPFFLASHLQELQGAVRDHQLFCSNGYRASCFHEKCCEADAFPDDERGFMALIKT